MNFQCSNYNGSKNFQNNSQIRHCSIKIISMEEESIVPSSCSLSKKMSFNSLTNETSPMTLSLMIPAGKAALPATAAAAAATTTTTSSVGDGASSSTTTTSTKCECCPYGFHIDTDFVRYCDALLEALNAQRTSSTKKFSQSTVIHKDIHKKLCSSSSSSSSKSNSSCTSNSNNSNNNSSNVIINQNGSNEKIVENEGETFVGLNSSEVNYRLRTQQRRKFNVGRTNTEMFNNNCDVSFRNKLSSFTVPNETNKFILNNFNLTQDNNNKNHNFMNDSSTQNFIKYCQNFKDDDHIDYDCQISNHNSHLIYYDCKQQLPAVIGYDEYSSSGSSQSVITSAFEVKTIAATKNTVHESVDYLTEGITNKYDKSVISYDKGHQRIEQQKEEQELLQQQQQQEQQQQLNDETFSESCASSSFTSSSIGSRSVLEQIRQHLAFSLQRVEALEQQVSSIPALREQIDILQAEKHQLQTKLMKSITSDSEVITFEMSSINNDKNDQNSKKNNVSLKNQEKIFQTFFTQNDNKKLQNVGDNNEVVTAITDSDFSDHKQVTSTKIENNKILTNVNDQSTSIENINNNLNNQLIIEKNIKNFKSVGTLTIGNVPSSLSLLSLNGTVKNNQNRNEIEVQTDNENILNRKYLSESTDTQDLFDSGFNEISVQTDDYCCLKITSSLDNSRDSSFFKSTCSTDDHSERSNSTNSILDLCHNFHERSICVGVHSNNDSNESGNVSAVTSRMANSVISTDDEHQQQQQHHHHDCRSSSTSFQASTSIRQINNKGLMKADSGISVERQSRTIYSLCDDVIMDKQNQNQSLNDGHSTKTTTTTTSSKISKISNSNTNSSSSSSASSDDETIDKVKKITKKSIKKTIHGHIELPLDMKKVRPTTEIRIALAILNENLLDLVNADRSIFNKNLSLIKQKWFEITSKKDSDSRIVEIYMNCFKEFSKNLLKFIINLQDDNENTALHYAVSYENFDIINILINSNLCDVNLFNKAGYTASMLAALFDLEYCEYKCDSGSSTTGSSACEDEDNRRTIVERLFRKANLNLKAKQNGQTALMLASSHGRAEVCRLLLDSGADVNLQDNDGSTALMCAAEHGHSEVISLLLSNFECDPHLEDNDGWCALKIALDSGHNQCAIRLYLGSRLTESNCSFNSSSSSIRNAYINMTNSFTMFSSSSSSSSASSPNHYLSSQQQQQQKQQPRYVPEPSVTFPYDCIESFSKSLQHLSITTPKANVLSTKKISSSRKNIKKDNKKLTNYSLSSPISPL